MPEGDTTDIDAWLIPATMKAHPGGTSALGG
jgi:hypothetical protein